MLVFNLVYAGTLGTRFLMFLGHLGALMVLLTSAAIAKLLTNVRGTLVVGALMFLGQLVALAILRALSPLWKSS